MAQCLHPVWIKVDRRADNPTRHIHSYFVEDGVGTSIIEYKRKYVRENLIDYVPVPCGKCINCLKNKQNAMVSRCIAESGERGTFSFVTLTYNNDTLPIAQSLWRASKDTGEIELVHAGEVVSCVDDMNFRKEDREKLLKMASSPNPRYYDEYIAGFEDDEYCYFSRLTPSLNRRDPRLWIKRCRVSYEREYGCKLDFSYVLVGEMGPRTCRPHYHLAFFGLSKDQVQYFADKWTLGYTCVKHVNSVNPDGTDGFAIASRYIGKYMSKGKFDCLSVLDKSAVKPRVCQSKGIGRSLVDWLKSRVYCYDLFGPYDVDSMFCPALGRYFTESEIRQIVQEVPKRLKYDSSYGFELPIPRLFRDDLFYHKKVYYEKKRKLGKNGEWIFSPSVKIVRKPTTLWSLVAMDLREHLSSNYQSKFLAFISRYAKGQIPFAVNAYEDYQRACIENSERSRETNYKQFLNSVKDGQ